MRLQKIWLVFLLLAVSACHSAPSGDDPAVAVQEQAPALTEAVFSVDKMTCAACPITVKKAMQGVAGVATVKVDFAAKTARVKYAAGVTDADSIAQASMAAGYPARLVNDNG